MQVYYSKRSFRLHSSQQSLPRKNGASCISFSLSLLSLSLYHHFQDPRLIHCLGPSPEQNIFSWTCCHEEKGFVQWSNPKIRRKVQMDMGIYICTPLFQTNPSLILKKNVLGQLPVCFFNSKSSSLLPSSPWYTRCPGWRNLSSCERLQNSGHLENHQCGRTPLI